MTHIAESCPITKLEDGLQLIHLADDRAIIWLDTITAKALARQTECVLLT